MGLGDAFWQYECTLCGRTDRHTHGLRHSAPATGAVRLARPIRKRPLILACLAVALVIGLVSTILTVGTGGNGGMAPPKGYAAGQLTFDDQFTGTSDRKSVV